MRLSVRTPLLIYAQVLSQYSHAKRWRREEGGRVHVAPGWNRHGVFLPMHVVSLIDKGLHVRCPHDFFLGIGDAVDHDETVFQ